PGVPGLYLVVTALLALAYFGAVLVAIGRLGPALRATVIAVVPGVTFAFAVVRIGRRARWFDGPRRRIVLLHTVLCAGYSAAWSVTVVVLFAVERWLFAPGGRFEVQMTALGFTSFTGVLLYGG